jgi:hypothetical protein
MNFVFSYILNCISLGSAAIHAFAINPSVGILG